MRRLIISTILILFTIAVKAQIVPYQLVETVSDNQNEVTFRIYVFCDKKKELDHSALLAGIRCVMFDGIPRTKFNKPLLSEGEKTLINKYSTYFNDLYEWRYVDYVKTYTMLSEFKKSGVGKSTLFEITVRAIDLRKDLENNHIRNKFGI